MRTAIIDGDTIAWLAAIRSETTADFGDTGVARVADLDLARAEVRRQIDDIRTHTGADSVLVALSCPTRHYWRMDILPSYKQHRAGGSAPVGLAKVKAWMASKANCMIRPNLEADDVVGILATNPKVITGDKVIVSIDKDLLQIPGVHFNPSKPELGLVTVTPEQGRRWHLTQTLIGDKTDGYAGCPGIGPKKAEKILKEFSWEEVLGAFEAAKLTPEDALVQARVARILTHSDWNYKKKEVRLWTPTTSSSRTPASEPSSQAAPFATPKKASRGTT